MLALHNAPITAASFVLPRFPRVSWLTGRCFTDSFVPSLVSRPLKPLFTPPEPSPGPLCHAFGHKSCIRAAVAPISWEAIPYAQNSRPRPPMAQYSSSFANRCSDFSCCFSVRTLLFRSWPLRVCSSFKLASKYYIETCCGPYQSTTKLVPRVAALFGCSYCQSPPRPFQSPCFCFLPVMSCCRTAAHSARSLIALLMFLALCIATATMRALCDKFP
jgi:hypothetical protein